MGTRGPMGTVFLELVMNMWFEGEDHTLPEEELQRLRDYLVGEIRV